jgi:hypothetical protein
MEKALWSNSTMREFSEGIEENHKNLRTTDFLVKMSTYGVLNKKQEC